MQTYPRFNWGRYHVATYIGWYRPTLSHYRIVHPLPQCDTSTREEWDQSKRLADVKLYTKRSF